MEHGSGQSTKRRIQFSVGQLLLLFIVLAVVLALTSQLSFVGATLSFYFAVGVTGWQLHRPRWLWSAMTGLAVFVLAYLASWVQFGRAELVHRGPTKFLQYQMSRLNSHLSTFAKENGEYPNSLDQLNHPQGYGDPSIFRNGQATDIWGTPFRYKRTGGDFQLKSLGRDGRPGGVDLDADVYLTKDHRTGSARLPVAQFLFDTDGSGSVFLAALVASLGAAATWFAAQPFANRRITLLLELAAVAAVSVGVASLLAIAYLALSQSSGH